MITNYSNREALYQAVLPRRAVGAELGVGSGANAASLLRAASPRELHLVDHWPEDAAHRQRQAEAERWGAGCDVVRVHHADAVTWLSHLPPRSLDWVYLDTTHWLEDTRRELAAMRGKVTQVIAGHDFCHNRQWQWGVVQAVIEAIQDGWLECIGLTTDEEYPSFACRVKDGESCES